MNMKLTNISLAVLVALGLVACGGSSSNDDATKDKTDETKTPIETPDTNNKKPIIENNGKEKPQDPRRAEPSGKVENNLTDITAIDKALYIDRQSRDAIAGYNGTEASQNIKDAKSKPVGQADWDALVKEATAGQADFVTGVVDVNDQGNLSYNPGSTDKADILRASSMYNYLEEQSKNNSLNEKGGIHPNPAFSYAKGGDGRYYRVKPANGGKWDDLNKNSTFEIVASAAKGDFGKGFDKIPMSEVVFIPNVQAPASSDSDDVTTAFKPKDSEFKNKVLTGSFKNAGLNVVDPENIVFFNLNRGEVQYKSFDLADHSYDLVKDFDTKNIKLDLSKVPVAKEIRTEKITLNYDVINGQATGTINDDEIVHKTAGVGAMKLYNLPYSRSSITINQAAVKDGNDPDAAPNNLFGLADTYTDGHYGAYQIAGFQTNVIPRDGRADYVGKSYGVNSQGDIVLRADFGIDRAGIHGGVKNRTTADGGRSLPALKLEEINLSGPEFQNTASLGIQSTSKAKDGVVTQGGRGVGAWAVGLYGPNAEEAAGVIDFTAGADADGLPAVNGPDVGKQGRDFEVFSSQRGTLGPLSLNPGVGN